MGIHGRGRRTRLSTQQSSIPSGTTRGRSSLKCNSPLGTAPLTHHNDAEETRGWVHTRSPHIIDGSQEAQKGEAAPAPPSKHINSGALPAWLIPSNKSYAVLFSTQSAGVKGWPYFNDSRPPKKGRTRRAPMCVRFQAMGECTQSCTLAHILPNDMGDTDRHAVEKRFIDLYG
jgi:hypothetical protein